METKRVDKINYYLSIAEAVAGRGTCLRKNYGCIIVKNDEIIATGYTGAPRGRKNCIDLGECTKKKILHDEQNAIISASRKDMIKGELYLVGIRKDTGEYEKEANSCQLCKKMIINAGIKKVIVKSDNEKGYIEIDVQDWIQKDDLLEGKITY